MSSYLHCPMVWRIHGSTRHAYARSIFFSISCNVLGVIAKIIGWRTRLWGRSPPCEIQLSNLQSRGSREVGAELNVWNADLMLQGRDTTYPEYPDEPEKFKILASRSNFNLLKLTVHHMMIIFNVLTFAWFFRSDECVGFLQAMR